MTSPLTFRRPQRPSPLSARRGRGRAGGAPRRQAAAARPPADGRRQDGDLSHLARLARRQVLVLAHREELLDAGPRQARSARSEGAAVVGRSSAARCARRRTRACWSARSARCTRSAWRRCCAGATSASSSTTSATTRPPRTTCACCASSAPSSRLSRARCSASPPRRRAATARGSTQVFEEIVYSRALPELIEDGFLAPLRGYRIATTADLRRLSATRARLRRGGAGRGGRHRGAQRAGRAVDPGAGARPPHDRVLRDGEPRPPPGRTR